ncbi:MAG: hypothetical protein FP816_06295 [Desulfobacteraceae bacterium]|nr:hypothetical protein [Desulfobacteraceae bacterium]
MIFKNINIRLSLVYVLFLILFSADAFSAETPLIKVGDLFPDIELSLPRASDYAEYLGVSGKTGFWVKDIQAQLVLVEIMNINCASCQKQAPVYNDLFDKIQSLPETKEKIKVLAIGVGNKNEHIQKYQDHFKAQYPIVEDPGLAIYNALGKSPVPLSLYVRLNKKDGKAVVVASHAGYLSDPEAMFTQLRSLMDMDADTAQILAGTPTDTFVRVKPILSEEALMEKISDALKAQGNDYAKPEKIVLEDKSAVYTSIRKDPKRPERVFVRVVSQPSPCDVCHDVHFAYLFEDTGKIVQLIPLKLSKYGNKAWTREDIAKMEQNLVGRSIENPFHYDQGVDAITSATITSLVIIESLNEGNHLFQELKAKGLVFTKEMTED